MAEGQGGWAVSYQPKIQLPPPTGNQALDQWLYKVAQTINGFPRMSWFSGTTPNSIHTGTPGDLAINLASGSTTTRVWIMGGIPTSLSTNKGWVTLMIGPP